MNKYIIVIFLLCIVGPSALLQSMERAGSQQQCMTCYVCNKPIVYNAAYINFECKVAEQPHVFHIECLQNNYNQSEQCPLDHTIVPQAPSTSVVVPTAPSILDECTVCMDSTTLIPIVPCGHKFCRACISQWGAQNATCPVCRTKIELEVSSLPQIPVIQENRPGPSRVPEHDDSHRRPHNNQQAQLAQHYQAQGRHQEQRYNRPNINYQPQQPPRNNRPHYTCRGCGSLLDDNDRPETNSCNCKYHHECLKRWITRNDTHTCSCGREFDLPLLTKMLNVSSGDMLRQAIAMGGQSLVHGIATYLMIRSLIASPDIRMGCIEAYLLFREKISSQPSTLPVSGIWHNVGNNINRYSVTRFFSNYLLAHRLDVKEISSLHRYERLMAGGLAMGTQCVISVFNKNNVLNTHRAQPLIQQSLFFDLNQKICFVMGLCAGRLLYKPLREAITARQEKRLSKTFTEALRLMRDPDTMNAGEVLLQKGGKMVTVLKEYRREIC